jgi:hypothetical protein
LASSCLLGVGQGRARKAQNGNAMIGQSSEKAQSSKILSGDDGIQKADM